jgi:hypothetical protein
VKPTAAQVKAAWDAAKKPSTISVAAALTEAGYPVSYKTVERYKKEHWAEPGTITPKKSLARSNKAIALVDKHTAEAGRDVATVDLGSQLARMDELRLISMAENQAGLQLTGLIAARIVAERMVAMIDKMLEDAPGDAARLLHAITEATQVKHVGGAGQVPEAGDPRVIDVTPNPRNEVSEAIARFKKNSGMA